MSLLTRLRNQTAKCKQSFLPASLNAHFGVARFELENMFCDIPNQKRMCLKYLGGILIPWRDFKNDL